MSLELTPTSSRSLDLVDDWVWDFWVVDDLAAPDDDEHLHVFFLHAPRSLGDPDLRHEHARVGHAVGHDLTSWRVVGDALAPQPAPAFDDLATWTGSVVRSGDTWTMFTSGITRTTGPRVQRIGVSRSRDLVSWERVPGTVMDLDDRWYVDQVADDPADPTGETHWRDPFVIADPAERGLWHAYVTAKTPHPLTGEPTGVVGHATSSDLEHWVVGPPLDVEPGRFDQLEVISLDQVDGRWVLIFSVLGAQVPGAAPGDGGVWSVPVDGPGAPVDVRLATRLTNEHLYVGRTVRLRDGSSRFVAFVNKGTDGRFLGGLTRPLHVGWRPDGAGLRLLDAPAHWLPAPSG